MFRITAIKVIVIVFYYSFTFAFSVNERLKWNENVWPPMQLAVSLTQFACVIGVLIQFAYHLLLFILKY